AVMSCDAQPEVEVDRQVTALVEKPDMFEDQLAYHHRREADEVVAKDLFEDVAAVKRRLAVWQLIPVLIDQCSPAVDDTERWLVLEERDLLFELLRMPDVVGVEEGDERPAGPFNPRVLRPRLAQVVDRPKAHARVAQVRFDDLARTVGR